MDYNIILIMFYDNLTSNTLQEVIYFMGELQNKLEKFQEYTKIVYAEIMNVLEDHYCWKCPMRSTSTQSRCREIHAGRVIHEALDDGIIDYFSQSKVSPVEVDAVIIRMLKKKIKREGGKQAEKIIIMNVEEGQNPDLPLNSWIKVKINPKRAKIGEKILIPPEKVEHPLLGSYALVAGFPFQIGEVKRSFNEGNFWYVEVEDNNVLPLESIFGVLINVFEDVNSFCGE